MINRINKSAICIIIIGLYSSITFSQTTSQEYTKNSIHYPSSKLPGDKPELFAEGFLEPEFEVQGYHQHSSPAFSPDGKYVFWSAYGKIPGSTSRVQTIFFSKFNSGKWSDPEVAPFSGKYSDGGPFFSQNGKKLFFHSNRPETPSAATRDVYTTSMWYLDITESGFGDPEHIGFRADKQEGLCSVSANGNIYFTADLPGNQGPFDIFITKKASGKYEKPQRLPATINKGFIKISPYIAPDESYIIVGYSGPSDRKGLYISFKDFNGEWGNPISLKPYIGTSDRVRFPMVSPDGKYFFFARYIGRTELVHWMKADFIHVLSEKHFGK